MSDRTPLYISVQSQLETEIKRIVDRILSSGKMSRQDHNLLISTVFANANVNHRERRQMNRILDHIQTGQLKVEEAGDWGLGRITTDN